MKILTSTPEFYFVLFYLLSTVVVFTLIIICGLKRGYRLRSLLLMLTTISLLTIIGSRLFTIPFNEWGPIITSGSIAEYNSRSAIGALLFGLAGLMFSQRFFGFNKPIFDLYAWVAPIGFGIQKMGCFFNGCCYGKLSNIFCTVQYREGSHAHFNHWTAGWIGQDTAFSLNVHPVQLYEMLFFFAIAFIVWRTRNFWKKSGSALLFALFLVFIFRFTSEFIRDPASSQFNVHYLWGISVFKWFLLMLAIVFGSSLLIYEKLLKIDFLKGLQHNPGLGIVTLYVLMIASLIFTFRGLFSTFEFASLGLKFIPVMLLIGYHLYLNITVKKYRPVTACLLILSFFLMAQSFPSDSEKVGSYKRLDFGTSIGGLYSQLKYNPHEGDCGTTYTREDYKHQYRIGGVGYSQVTHEEKSITTWGVNLHGGINKETNLTKNIENSFFLFGVNPYIKYDLNWVGIGFGGQFGNIRWIPLEPIDERTFNNGTKSFWMMPEFYARLGRRDIIDIDYTYGFTFPSSYPAMATRISIGSGFGQKADYSLRFGLTIPTGAKYISAEGRITRQFGANMMIIFDDDNFPQPPGESPVKIVFGVNYRFGFEND